MSDKEKLELAVKILKFCPCCKVVYFGCDRCQPCTDSQQFTIIELVPLLKGDENKAVTQDQMNEIARVWLKSRDVIVKFLKEFRPDLSQEHLEHNAAAIIARLSHANLSIEELKP